MILDMHTADKLSASVCGSRAPTPPDGETGGDDAGTLPAALCDPFANVDPCGPSRLDMSRHVRSRTAYGLFGNEGFAAISSR